MKRFKILPDIFVKKAPFFSVTLIFLFILLLDKSCARATTAGENENEETQKNQKTEEILQLAENVQETIEGKRFLLKCSNKVGEKFLVIPPTLRAPPPPRPLLLPVPPIAVNESTKNAGFFTPDNYDSDSLTEKPFFPADFNFTLQLRSAGERKIKKVQITLDIINNYTAHISPKNRNSTVHLYAQTRHYFTTGGFLKSNRTFYSPDNFCISNISEDALTVDVYENDGFSVNKCCPFGMVFSLDLNNPTEAGRCRFSDTEFTPVFYPKLQSKKYKVPQSLENTPNFEYKPIGSKQCSWQIITIPIQSGRSSEFTRFRQIRMLENGEIYTRVSGNHGWKKNNQSAPFCIDGLWTVNGGKFQNGENFQVILSCPETLGASTEFDARTLSKIYFGAYTISGFLLSFILLVYGCIWTKQKIHGWTISMFVLCAMGFSFSVAATHAISLWAQNNSIFGIGSNFCLVLAVFGHFFYVAFFSWMTVVNFDILNTIRSMTPSSKRSKGKRAFILYCTFGFGVPAITVGVSQFIEQYFGFFDDRIIRPQYGRSRCFLDRTAVFYHGILVNSLLFSINLVMALLTLKTLWHFKKDSDALENSQSKISGKQKTKVWLFLKLFCLMGFSWMFELLSEFVVFLKEEKNQQLSVYWSIFDLFNALQAIFLFYIFVYKKEVQEQFNGGLVRAGQSLSRLVSRSSIVPTSTTISDVRY